MCLPDQTAVPPLSLSASPLTQVEVFEEQPVVGGACRTEYPFPKVPGLGHSTGAYLLGVMPPELVQVCDDCMCV